MRRRTQLITLAAIAGLSTVAITPLAHGATHRPAAPAKHHKYPPACKPKFRIAAQQKLDADEAGLYAVVTADNTHSYAVGSSYQERKNSTLKFTALLDEGVGSNWSLNDHPGGVSLTNAFLHDVDASSNHNVWAIGQIDSPKERGPLILHKTKAGWDRVDPDTFGDYSPRAVITTSPSNVWIGGTGKGNEPVVFHFDGKKWTSEKFLKLRNFLVTGMTFLGKSPALVANEIHTPQGDDVQKSVVLVHTGGAWTSVPFDYPTLATGVTGTSKHNIWVSSDDETLETDKYATVYHYTDSWLPIYDPDLEVWGVSSRGPNGTWFGGYVDDNNASVDVWHDTYGVGSSQEFAGDDGGYYYAIDAHGKSRVLAVGVTHVNDKPQTLIEQAVC